jgi:hypothetical protein
MKYNHPGDLSESYQDFDVSLYEQELTVAKSSLAVLIYRALRARSDLLGVSSINPSLASSFRRS